MIEMLKARKEALQEQGVKGFTLMEMLIVIAIVAILVAIAIPIFTDQLDKAKLATDTANARSAVAELVAAKMIENPPTYPTDTELQAAVSAAMTQGCTATASGGTVTVKLGDKTETFSYDVKTS